MSELDLNALHGDLPGDCIDIWHLDLIEDRGLWDLLDQAERDRARRLRILDKRVQFVAARSQIRQILASYLGDRPEALQFSYGEHGKPSLPSAPELSFNLSHSRQAGLLAVARGADIDLGVDVEFRKPDRRFEGIAGRFFSASEHQALLSLPAAERPAAFYRAWTRKEAYLKAWGTGLSFPSNRFTISYALHVSSELIDSEMPGEGRRPWHFQEIRACEGFAAALCYPGAERWLRHFVALTPKEM